VDPLDAAAAIEMFTLEVPTDPALLLMALKDLISFKASVFTTGEQTRVIWDSGASILVTPSMEDFVGPFSTTTLHNELKGLAKGLKIFGLRRRSRALGVS
jgi:hypothetical protein